MAEQMLVDLAESLEHAQAVGWDASEDRVWVEWEVSLSVDASVRVLASWTVACQDKYAVQVLDTRKACVAGGNGRWLVGWMEGRLFRWDGVLRGCEDGAADGAGWMEDGWMAARTVCSKRAVLLSGRVGSVEGTAAEEIPGCAAGSRQGIAIGFLEGMERKAALQSAASRAAASVLSSDAAEECQSAWLQVKVKVRSTAVLMAMEGAGPAVHVGLRRWMDGWVGGRINK